MVVNRLSYRFDETGELPSAKKTVRVCVCGMAKHVQAVADFQSFRASELTSEVSFEIENVHITSLFDLQAVNSVQTAASCKAPLTFKVQAHRRACFEHGQLATL